jgi:hypothetical protein
MLALKLPLLCATAAVGPQAIISATIKIDQPALFMPVPPSMTLATALGNGLFPCPVPVILRSYRLQRECQTTGRSRTTRN